MYRSAVLRCLSHTPMRSLGASLRRGGFSSGLAGRQQPHADDRHRQHVRLLHRRVHQHAKVRQPRAQYPQQAHRQCGPGEEPPPLPPPSSPLPPRQAQTPSCSSPRPTCLPGPYTTDHTWPLLQRRCWKAHGGIPGAAMGWGLLAADGRCLPPPPSTSHTPPPTHSGRSWNVFLEYNIFTTAVVSRLLRLSDCFSSTTLIQWR